jgi:omega-hydroxy-beta-dihydromenaquinone-9 sulfotransferase
MSSRGVDKRTVFETLKPSRGDSTSDPLRRPLLHPLAGARPAALIRILSRHGGFSSRRAGQVAIMFACALARWPLCMIEQWRVARRVEAVTFDPPPVFIIGHWRSGTTFLHNLMSKDPAFCFPTILDALRPYDFYPSLLEPISRWVLLRFLPTRRPMDDIPLSPGLPQEDEIALATMGAPSLLNCFYFPRRVSQVFAKEVLFEGANSVTLESWSSALRYYAAKLAALNPGRRLLLKNPAHSVRIRQLRALFPGAKFIHIRRHPFAVFQSTRRLYHGLLPLTALQDYEPHDIDEHIVSSYPQVMNRLLDGLAELPSDVSTTVSYEDLVEDPAGIVERIYRELKLGEFDRVKRSISAQAGQGAPRFPSVGDLDQATASRLAVLWSPVLTRLGYSWSDRRMAS